MLDINITYERSSNIVINPKDCPLGYEECYSSLGKYKKECPMHKGFYLDTTTSMCIFDEQTEENKKVLLELAARRKK